MSDIKFSNGWYMPDQDRAIESHMKCKNMRYNGRLMWQYGVINDFWSKIKGKDKLRTAIDVGSHIGMWTYFLADKFNFVHCFEPIKIHQDCWQKNVGEYENVKLHPIALGYKEEKVQMMFPEQASVAAQILKHPYTGSYEHILLDNIQVTMLDNFEFMDISFIKIDVEGYELKIIKGAEKTILRNKPYILIEDFHKETPAVKYLEDLGMGLISVFKNDHLMGWGKYPQQDKKFKAFAGGVIQNV